VGCWRPAPSEGSAADTAAQYAQLYAGTPKLTVTTVAPSKHFIMLDQPAVFAADLDAFLAG